MRDQEMKEIRAHGKSRNSYSDFTAHKKQHEQTEDYWGDTRSGDFAYVIGMDLFTNAEFIQSV